MDALLLLTLDRVVAKYTKRVPAQYISKKRKNYLNNIKLYCYK